MMSPETVLSGGVLDALRAFDKAVAISLATYDPISWELHEHNVNLADEDPARYFLRVAVSGKIRWEKGLTLSVLGLVTLYMPKKGFPADEVSWRISSVKLSIERSDVVEYTATQLANFKFH